MKNFLPEDITEHRKPDYEIHPQFLTRWSPRSFLTKEVPEAELLALFEAARWAPSASNLQPWRYILARTPEDRDRFYSFINPGNLAWCRNAPALALVLSKSTNPEGKPNRAHAFDTGASWGHLALEAVNRGLVTHAMGGFDRDRAREVLQVPTEYELHAVIAIGYHGNKEALSEAHQEREKPSGRQPLQASVFEGTFGQVLGTHE